MKLKFEVWGEIEMCEAFHVGIIKEMTTGKEIESSEIVEKLEYYKVLIQVALQPYEKEYSVVRYGSHIAIDRAQKICSSEAGSRLGVVGLC